MNEYKEDFPKNLFYAIFADREHDQEHVNFNTGDKVLGVINRLKSPYKTAVIAHFIEDLDFDKIAKKYRIETAEKAKEIFESAMKVLSHSPLTKDLREIFLTRDYASSNENKNHVTIDNLVENDKDQNELIIRMFDMIVVEDEGGRIFKDCINSVIDGTEVYNKNHADQVNDYKMYNGFQFNVSIKDGAILKVVRHNTERRYTLKEVWGQTSDSTYTKVWKNK